MRMRIKREMTKLGFEVYGIAINPVFPRESYTNAAISQDSYVTPN